MSISIIQGLKMRHFWPLLLFIAIFIFIVIQAKDEMPITTVEPTSPQRIISIAPSITESLFALGVGDRVIAVSDYCDYPSQVATLPKVGGFLDPNLEAILALQPDLVILLENQTRAVEQLKQLNIKTLTVRNETLATIKNTLIRIGQQTDHLKQAQKIMTEMDQKIAFINGKIKGLNRPKVMVTIGHSLAEQQVKTIYISGQHDFYNDLITLAGGQNVYSKSTPKVPSLSLEGLLTLNPDVIIDIFPEADDHNSDLTKVKQQWQSLGYINAIQQNRVHIIEQSYATIPGPRIMLLLDQFAQIIHPEIDWTDLKP
ncbi:MAG: helical backbone metal receptor [Gammaproteobacteria bacterium]|nr:helical backbone metal receptor [Gammaproteobacteria bacterium]